MLIYVAGPYTADTTEARDANIARARDMAIKLWRRGFTVFCPHTNTARWDELAPDLTHADYMRGDLEILSRCDAIVMLDGWMRSKGANIEHAYALEHNIPIIHEKDLDSLVVPAVETRSPQQVEGFRSIIGQMYRLHLSKNEDYSAANILLTGEVGLATRVWDKTARLLNLMGFRVNVSPPDTFAAPKAPKHESVDDTLFDLSVYGVIGLLLRRGKWGR